MDCVPVDAFDSKYFWKWRDDTLPLYIQLNKDNCV